MYDPNTDGFYYREPPQKMVFDGKRMRKPIQRKTVDYNCPMVEYLENRVYLRDHRDYPSIQPSSSYLTDLMPPIAYEENPATSIGTHFVHTSTNKVRGPVNQVLWTPEGRRLVTGSFSGEFTLWNGLTFNFETILQAHDTAVRTMVWSHNENFMISGDTGGYIKYWQPNMNNVKAFRAHEEAIRGLSFSPTDAKFVSCSDDVKIKIWDFLRGEQEQVLEGHGWDVKSVSWHPFKSLIVSGSKDNLVKVWDAKSGKNVSTIHGHKNTVLKVACNDNGNWFVSASRDCMLRLFDIRMMKELQAFRGHDKEVNSVAWHPIHEGMFASGGFDGSIMFWVVGSEKPQAELRNAHENSVWSLDWHPLGHILCSGSNDHTTKFWCRNRPGDPMTDRYNAVMLPAGKAEAAAAALESGMDVEDESEGQTSLPGLGGSTDDLGFDGLLDDQPTSSSSYRDGRGDRGRGGSSFGGRRDEFGRARDGGRDGGREDFGRDRRGFGGGGDREPRGGFDRDRGGYDRERGPPGGGGDRGRRGPPGGGPNGGGGGAYRSAPPPTGAPSSAAAKQPYNPFAQYGGGSSSSAPPGATPPPSQPYGGGPPPGGAPPPVGHAYGGGMPPPSSGYGGPPPGGYAPPPQRPPASYGMHPPSMPPPGGLPPPSMGYGGGPPPHTGGGGGGYPPPTGMMRSGMAPPPGAVFNAPPPGYGGMQPPAQPYRGGPPPGQPYHQR